MILMVCDSYRELRAFGRVFKVSCIVKPRTAKMTVAYSENQDRTQGIPYQPLQFPKGLWNVLDAELTTHPLMAPVFIDTDAHQTITGLDGVTKSEDFGYGIHFDAKYEETWGCLHLYSPDDAMWLKAEIDANRRLGIQLLVQ